MINKCHAKITLFNAESKKVFKYLKQIVDDMSSTCPGLTGRTNSVLCG